jgi:hypothetical protein
MHNMTDSFNDRLALALDFVDQCTDTEAAFTIAAHQYNLDIEILKAEDHRRCLQWAASRGYDF